MATHHRAHDPRGRTTFRRKSATIATPATEEDAVLLDRNTIPDWPWLVYVEMFIAGIAAGAYAVAAAIEVLGRRKTDVVRAAHLIAFPLMALATLLLVLDLKRPERFWHMVVMNLTWVPMLKWYSPMSLGTWLVSGFTTVAFVSFLDMLVERGWFALGPWRRGFTLHGSRPGLAWSVAGAVLALGVTAYSALLLNVNNVPGWGHASMLGPLFVATSLVSGIAALLLLEAVRGRSGLADALGLLAAATMLVVWWLVTFVAFLATTTRVGLEAFLTGLPLLALVGALVLGGIVPVGLRLLATGPSRTVVMAFAMSVLIGTFLLRYAVVMGPQHG
jgi:formate-dependent nitrite reductase membrane component NrfD